MDSHQLAAPSCRCRACPAALSPSAWAAPGALRVGPAPRPRLPPRPPRLRPELAGAAPEPRERSEETAAARGAPASPAPDPTKRPAEGCREPGARESRGATPAGSRRAGRAPERRCVWTTAIHAFPRAKETEAREDTCQLPRFWPSGPSRLPAGARGERSLPSPAALAGGGSLA